MCLSIDDKTTQKVRKRLQNSEYIDYYKCFDVLDNKLYSNIRMKRVKLNRDNFYVSNRWTRQLTWIEKRFNIVNKGIHVYLYHPPLDFSHFCITIRVRCFYKDFIAAGSSGSFVKSAVFRQVKFLESVEEINRRYEWL